MKASRALPRRWLGSAGAVTAVHAALVAAALWLGMGERPVHLEEPVVLIDLPPLAASAAVAPAAQQYPETTSAQPPLEARPPVEAPRVEAPLPRDYVAVPPPAPIAPSVAPVRPAPASVAVAAPAPASARAIPTPIAAPKAGTGSAATDGDNPKAKQQEADYFALLSAHLNKRKRYPVEAKKARQQGVVTLRFTVHADGSITGGTIRKSSGHDVLDAATLDLLQRVAPLPKFPKSMTKASVTLSLPIDYSLQTS